MSRGLGRVQQRVLTYLRREPLGRENGRPMPVDTAQIADVVYGHRTRRRVRLGILTTATVTQRKATRRALLGLEQRGLVERAPWRPGQASSWRLKQ